MDNFTTCCMEIPELGKHMENGINVDPITLTMDEFRVAGNMADGKVCNDDENGGYIEKKFYFSLKWGVLFHEFLSPHTFVFSLFFFPTTIENVYLCL